MRDAAQNDLSESPEEVRHSPTPWRVRRDRVLKTCYRISSDADSRAIQKWNAKHPNAERYFSGVEICCLSRTYNGSGNKYGPDELISLAEVRANAELIVRAVNAHNALVEAAKKAVQWFAENQTLGVTSELIDALALAEGKQ